MASQAELVDDLLFNILLDLVQEHGFTFAQETIAFERFLQRLRILRQMKSAQYAEEFILGMICAILWETDKELEVGFIPQEKEEIITIHYPGCSIDIPMDSWSDELRLDVDDVLDQHYRMVEAVLLKYGIILEVIGNDSSTENVENVEEKMRGAIDQIDLDQDPEDLSDSQSS